MEESVSSRESGSLPGEFTTEGHRCEWVWRLELSPSPLTYVRFLPQATHWLPHRAFQTGALIHLAALLGPAPGSIPELQRKPDKHQNGRLASVPAATVIELRFSAACHPKSPKP